MNNTNCTLTFTRICGALVQEKKPRRFIYFSVIQSDTCLLKNNFHEQFKEEEKKNICLTRVLNYMVPSLLIVLSLVND